MASSPKKLGHKGQSVVPAKAATDGRHPDETQSRPSQAGIVDSAIDGLDPEGHCHDTECESDLESDDESQVLSLLKERMSTDIREAIGGELSVVDHISRFSESIENRLHELYLAKFPKKCNNCSRIYKTRVEYLKATHRLRQGGTMFEEVLLQECRNCVCGSTLAILTPDRRDDTEFGRVRRALFDECVRKLSEVSKISEEELIGPVRQLFRTVINKAIEDPDSLAAKTSDQSKAPSKPAKPAKKN